MLTLSEKLLLLGLHDEKGSVVFSASTALPYGLAGALLIELYLTQRIDFVGKHVRVMRSDKSSSELLNETYQLIASSSKLRDAKYWVKAIHSKVKKIQNRLAEQLVEKKVLSRQERSFLWVINFNRYPTRDAKPESDVRAHIKDVVLRRADASEADVALLSLVLASELITEVFDKDDRKTAKKRIEELAKEQKIGKAISQVVEEVKVAIMVVIVASTVATTATS